MASYRLQMLTSPEMPAETDQTRAAPTQRQLHVQTTRARLERLWMQDAQQFDPLRSATERLRHQRNLAILGQLPNSEVVDLGCGYGLLLQHLADLGHSVTGIDAASLALATAKKMSKDRAKLHRAVLPDSPLDDGCCDLVLCLDLIAELPKRDHRLLFSEASRLLKRGGRLILSTEIAPASTAIQNLAELMQTEFEIKDHRFSYHRIQQGLLSLLQRLNKRCASWLEQNDAICQKLEQLTQRVYGDAGITHVILTGLKKDLF